MSLALTRRTLIAAAFAAALLPGAAAAITEEERAALNEIAQKLAGIQTMNGEFLQFNPDGSQQQGKFYIARPGRVRFEYEPARNLIVSDGDMVLVHDRKLQTYDLWPLSQTPLR